MHGYGMASQVECKNEATEITDERDAATGCEGQRRLSPEMVMTETKQNQYGRRASVQLDVAGPRHYNRHTTLSFLPSILSVNSQCLLLTHAVRFSLAASRRPMSTSYATTQSSGEVVADTRDFSVLPRALPFWAVPCGNGEVHYQNGSARVSLHL